MQLKTIETLFEQHPFFHGFAPEHLELLAGCSSNVRFDAGQYMAREGDDADSFYLIRHGKVFLEISAPGRGGIAIETLAEGDVLGWSWLVPPYRWQLDARAVELTRAISLDGQCLRAKSEQDPRLGYELMKRIAPIIVQRLQATRLQLLDVYGKHG
jgi:CRP/FNR family transcriptional regulator, cyclic AMP receptor protein